MTQATKKDRSRVIEILSGSFDSNQSVNYIIPQDAKRAKRFRALMEYSFDVCSLSGDVFLSEDRSACALVLYPDQKRTTLRSLLLDLRLIINCIGLSHLKKALAREDAIKKLRVKDARYYLWFIGVAKEQQGQGLGSKLMQELIEHSRQQNLDIYLETSTPENLPWYQNMGFGIYQELDLGYRLFFLKRPLG